MATILAILQSAAPYLGKAVPASVFGSSDRDAVEFAEAANETGAQVARAYDWNVLKRLQTYTGNGENDGWALPADYDRMPLRMEVYTSRYEAPLYHVDQHDEWLQMLVRSYQTVHGSWTLLGGQIVFYPVLDAGETAKLYYMSKNWVTDVNGAVKDVFTADDDTFRVDDRLMKLALSASGRSTRACLRMPRLRCMSPRCRNACRVTAARGCCASGVRACRSVRTWPIPRRSRRDLPMACPGAGLDRERKPCAQRRARRDRAGKLVSDDLDGAGARW